MSKAINIVGLKFGRLIVTSRAENKGKQPRWNCLCDCGKLSVKYGAELKGNPYGGVLRCGYNCQIDLDARPAPLCTIPGCREIQNSVGKRSRITLCKKHYKKRWRLWTRYRITPEGHLAILASQEYRCAICKSEKSRPGVDNLSYWHVDHDHACCPGEKSCGKCVRGLLCGLCNHGLGSFRDNPNFMIAASDYVRIHKKQETKCQ